MSKRSVLITGCSDNSLGAGIALAFHARGLRVFATIRDIPKGSSVQAAGIELVTLDVLDNESIKKAVQRITELTGGTLDILINNAGRGYNMPVSDIDIDEGKKLFDLNVWSYIAISQAFLPLLLRRSEDLSKASSKEPRPLIVNNTSISSVLPTAFNAVYHASKAAAAMFSDQQRIELAPFGIRVVDLKTGAVHTNFHSNRQDKASLPPTSIYMPIKDKVEEVMGGAVFTDREDLSVWAESVVGDLVGKEPPPPQIWRGRFAGETWARSTFYSAAGNDKDLMKEAALDVLEQKVKEDWR